MHRTACRIRSFWRGLLTTGRRRWRGCWSRADLFIVRHVAVGVDADPSAYTLTALLSGCKVLYTQRRKPTPFGCQNGSGAETACD